MIMVPISATATTPSDMIEVLKGILGDTPTRIEVDFVSPSPGGPADVVTAVIESKTWTKIQIYCKKNKISTEAFALGALYHTLRAYSHESFAIGLCQHGGNMVLVPFTSSRDGGEEALQAIHDRWTNHILPLSEIPYEEVKKIGYGCNVSLSIFNKISKENKEDHELNIDLSIDWMECSSGDGSIEVSFESGIGPWPGINDRFQQIISQILTSTGTSSSPLDNLLPHERAQVLKWGTGAKDPIRDCCLHELVEGQARIRPHSVALLDKCGTEKMTYAELDAKANRLAAELQKKGAKPNTYVGILMAEKTFEMCVAVLGVLKSGAAYVPMHAVLFPSERIKFIAEDTNMKLMVTVRDYAGLVEGDFEMVLVEEAVENKCNDGAVLEREVKPEDCAYMIYTSGTTGTPKGVACHHIGPVNMIFYESGIQVFSQGTPGEDVVGCSASHIFDMFVHGCFGALGSGLTLSLDMKCCTILMCTPSVAEILLGDETNNIRVMLVGGEAAIQGLETKVETFINGYGPTEASMICTGGNKPDTIGFPLPNTLCYVVHPDDGTLCPPGISGELWVGGIGVGIGYYNRPELTSEKFIPNPFASGRVYKTGDRVKWNDDGELVYLGRFDHQVKVRGYRIELGEIQAELEKQAGVKGALVVVYEENLVAFVASGVADDFSKNEGMVVALMAALRSESCRLPSYMIPSRIVVMEEFPLTQNGKIDRKFLIAGLEDIFVGGLETEYVAPESDEEVEMVRHWQAVFGTERSIGMNDNFHDLGGHSILAMALAARLDCDVRFISSHPTPASLLAHLQSLGSSTSGIDFSSLEEVPNLTRTEQRMLFIQLNNPDGTTYNLPFRVRFRSGIDLLSNVQTVVDALPILHTRFVNGKAVEDARITVQDLTAATSSEIQRILYCHFDMTAGPLCRFGVDTKTNVLYGNIHHSVADGRSFQILFEAFATGQAKVSTIDFSVRRYAAFEALPEVIDEQQALLKRYVELLGDTPPRFEVDFATPNSYHTSSIILDRVTRTALVAYCRKERISLFSLSLGVMHQVLRAYSHEAHAIGTVFDSRPSQFWDTVGMFVNTVLVPFGKSRESGHETLKQLNDRWSNDILPLAATPFDLVSSAGYGCNLCFAFNVGIIETNTSAPKMQSLPVIEEGSGFDAQRAMFDLTVEWMECSSGDVSIEVSFESGIGPWPGITDRFQQIISQILTSTGTSSSPLDNLLPHERAQVLKWGTGAKDPIRDCCLHELVEEQARIRPYSVALLDKCGTEKMTYAELDAKANRLAVELQKKGAKPNTYVGILMGEKTFEMYVAVLGVLKSGAAYVPMDAVLFPSERIKFIAEDTDMKLMVTVRDYAGLVEGDFEMVLVEEAVENKCNDGAVLEREVKPDDCAYMIYTSSTTGTPKGVACNHIGPVNMMFYESGVEIYRKGTPGEDVVGCAPPLIFDFFVYGYFITLVSGLTLSLDMKCCTMLICTPSVADILLGDGTDNIKVMVVGGEAAIQGLETKVDCFVNIYGPTEASIYCTSGNKPDTIGFPLPNTLCYVVHPDDGTLCPPGISGELWVGGIGVGIGYYNRPELTSEKFIPNPFASGRVYKTGDRVKWNDDGELVYLGRFDHQVKVRGYRIELGEIQAELEKQAGVKGALVVVYEENLVAFVASGVADDFSKNEGMVVALMAALRSESCRLPSYMIPSRIVVMEEFPLTQNGKIDRKFLIAGLEDIFVGGLETEYVAPESDEEVEMVRHWQAVFGTERSIGMNDNFHDLGGHSILAMTLAARLDCDVRFISSHPTPASLLAHLQSLGGSASGIDFSSLEEVPNLTRTEQRMLFIQLSNPNETTYNIPFRVRFRSEVDLLSNAQTVVDALPILHTRFVNGKAVEDARITVQDLTAATSSEIQRILYCHFDMTAGPLCRFGVDTKTNVLYGNIHHSVADGRSLQILFEAFATGQVKVSTIDFSVRRYAAFEALPEVIDEQQALLKRYVELLGDTPPRFEVDFATPNSYHTSSIILDRVTRTALEAYCRKERISLFSLSLGVMHQVLRAYSHEAHAIGTVFDSRPSQFWDTVGMFANTVLVPFGKSRESGHEETLKQLNDRWSNDILPLAATPFDLVSSAGYGCNLCFAFNVGIIETNTSAPKMQSLPVIEEGSGFDAQRAMFDLTVEWMECSSGDGSIEVSFESGIGPWPGITDRFQQIISQILTSTGTSSSPLDNLLPHERAQVLKWGTGAKDPIRDCCLHELVEEQARIRPDSVALLDKCGTEKMTYAELDAKANRLAVELQKKGAKPNTYVGILMGEKTFEMYVAVLGVLKSGAAYVPMDAVLFPSERIKFIAEDTDMKLMVTVRDYAGLVEGDFEMVLVEEAVENKCNDGAVLEREVKPDDCAYMIYTSGTTGTPKGVACHHIGPVNMTFYESGIQVFSKGTPGEDVVGCAAPHIFDVFVYDCIGALGSGLTLSLDMKCCTMLSCTPSASNIFLGDKTNSIRIMVVGSEACIQGLETKVETFINCYGPTEASIQCTGGNKPDTIGFPLPNTLCYVVHPDDGTLCPPGISGELWVGGIGVAIGYYNRPELTSEKFIPNPFASGRVYKTGDRVKWNDEGELVYLGRFDHQVKVRGYRIELGEIQAELEKQAGVKGALVVVYEENLVAFVASGVDDTSWNDVFSNALVAALKRDDCSLASYMIPWKILVIKEFPLTQNGKIDRKILIAQVQNDILRASLVGTSNAAETITQQLLCNLFEEILRVEVVGIDCDFIERGGHSLLVMQAVARIREEFGIDSFTVRQFIELKTARNIAQKIDECLEDKRRGGRAGRSFVLSLLSINSIANSRVRRDENLFVKVLIKAVAVLVLFTSCWVAILPANILLSKALSITQHAEHDSRGYGKARIDFTLYMASIGVLVAAFLMFFICLAILSRFYGYLLCKTIGKGPTTIKRSTATFGLWYVFDRLWYMTRTLASGLFRGTAFHVWFYKAYAGDIGRNNFFEGTDVRLPFMLSTGDNVVVEAGAKLETLAIKKNGDVAVDKLVLGKDTVIGPNTHIGLGAKVGDSCLITCLSIVQRGRKIADATKIAGHNATELDLTAEGAKNDFVEDQAVASVGMHLAFLLISFIPSSMFILISVLVVYLTIALPHSGALALLVTGYPVFMTIGQTFVAICMRPLRRAIIGGRAKPGWERIYSQSFLRRQLATGLYHSSLKFLEGTVVYHAVSRFVFGAEIDFKSSFTPHLDEPDLTRIGVCVFGANGVLLRNRLFYTGGIVRYGNVDIGDRSIILDRAVIAPGTSLENEVMVAPITSVNEDTSHESGTVLLGNPALNLNRKTGDVEVMKITSEPPFHLLLQYFIFMYGKDAVLLLTLSAFYANGIIFHEYCDRFIGKGDIGQFAISFAMVPISLVALVVVLLMMCLVIKWLVIRNFKRFKSKGLMAVDSWDVFWWMISNQLIHTACGLPLRLLDEFWLTATFWKLMGAKIGKNTLIDPDALLLEVDLLEIGDNCRIEEECTLLCHKFNDGGLKLDDIVIPSSTYIQARAVVLPGSEISDEHVTILPLTPLNPGEKLTAAHWQGSPAERVNIKTGKLLPGITQRSTMLSERTTVSMNDVV